MITIKHSSVVGLVLAAIAVAPASRADDQPPIINTLRDVYSDSVPAGRLLRLLNDAAGWNYLCV